MRGRREPSAAFRARSASRPRACTTADMRRVCRTTLAVRGDKTVLQEQSVLLTLVANLPDGQGLRLQLSLRGLDGAPLLGPVLLTQQPQQAAAVSCLSFN